MRGEWQDNDNSVDTSDDFLGYYFGLEILKGAVLPVDGHVAASRYSTVFVGSLGQRSEYEITEFNAAMNWKFAPLPTLFGFRERSTFSISQSSIGSASLLRDDTERRFVIKSENSKLLVDFEWRSLDDHIPLRSNDFDVYRLNSRHLFQWGRGSELTSSLRSFYRTGFNGFEQADWTQSASIYHTKSLSSSAGYAMYFTRQKSTAKRYSAFYRLRHRLYSNLTTSAGLRWSHRSAPNLVEVQEFVDLDIGYQKSVLWGTHVGIFLGGAYGHVDRDSDLGFYEIIDERYTVPISGQLILTGRFIFSSSVIVTDVTSNIIYQDGLDYELLNLGDGITQLSVLPAGRIQAGDIILVSYKGLILPSVEYNRISRTSALNVSFRGLSLSYRDDALNHKVISGFSGPLLDTKNEVLNLNYSLNFNKLSMGLRAERRLVKIGGNELKSKTANQSFNFQATNKVKIGLNLTQSLTENRTETITDTFFQEVDFYAGSLFLTWQPVAGMMISPTVSAWKRKLVRTSDIIESSDDTILSASLSFRWVFRKLSMNFSYQHNDRTVITDGISPGEDTIEDSVQFNLRRQFR
jgi:hypothetical protein